MNFWQLQMMDGLLDEEQLTTEEVKEIIVEKNIIGTNEWRDNKNDQCKKFKEAITIGDIVFVRNGMTPIALVEVILKNIPCTVYKNEHKIKLLSLYDEAAKSEIGIYEGQSQGTLTSVVNKKTPTAKFIINWHSFILKKKSMNSILNLIQYKKQIILQGPPGTGKTKLAKEIAEKLIRPLVITKEDIQSAIKIGQKIISSYDKIPYKVTVVNDTGVSLQLENGTTQTRNYNHIIQAYTNLIENKPIAGGETYQAAIAKYIYESIINSQQYKIIQFHPSYSYEDFVRGIVAKSNGANLDYKVINKLFGELAIDAADNYRKSQVASDEELSIEQWIDTNWSAFVKVIENEVAVNGYFKLTNKVHLVEVEEDCFRYTGDDWTLISRINFKDCKIIIKHAINNNPNYDEFDLGVSKHAYYRQSYYTPIIRKFLADYEYEKSDVKKEKLKNFVLIIDEINRANLSVVLGELIYALEYRGEKVESMYAIDDDKTLILPSNLFIIGTMNTADRSVGHIDYAIRRRFAFVNIMPKDLSSELGDKFHKRLFDEVASMFNHNTNLSKEFEVKDVQLGHSYFIDKSSAGGSMDIRLEYEIKPILLEYVKDGILTGEKIKEAIENLHA